jgi:hypothetical protein
VGRLDAQRQDPTGVGAGRERAEAEGSRGCGFVQREQCHRREQLEQLPGDAQRIRMRPEDQAVKSRQLGDVAGLSRAHASWHAR